MKTMSYLRILAGVLLLISSVVIVGCEERGQQTATMGTESNANASERTVASSSEYGNQMGIEPVGQSRVRAVTSAAEQTATDTTWREGLDTDTQSLVAITELDAREIQPASSYEIHQILHTSSRDEYEQIRNQLLATNIAADGENHASLKVSANNGGYEVSFNGDSEANRQDIQNTLRIAVSENQKYILVTEASEQKITLLSREGTILWGKNARIVGAFVSNTGNVVVIEGRKFSDILTIIDRVIFITWDGKVVRMIMLSDDYWFEGTCWNFFASGNICFFTAFPKLQEGPNGPLPATKPTLVIMYDFLKDTFYKYEAQTAYVSQIEITLNRYICTFYYDDLRNTILNIIDAETMQCDTMEIADSTVLSPYIMETNNGFIFLERSRYWEQQGMAFFRIYNLVRKGVQ